MSHDPQGPGRPEQPQQGPNVTITVNGAEYTIHRGRQTVAEIKQAARQPLEYVLEQDIDGKLTPLPNDGAVTLKGGEVFLASPPASQSSSA